MSHEMGHCLGLVHTFNDPPQYVNDPLCDVNGDYVCDTPADPAMNHAVDPNTCQYQLVKYDPLGVLYDPDEKNIMGYTHIDCMEYFSAGQGQRMRDIIAQNSALQQVLINSADVVINGPLPVTWTPASFPNGLDIGGNLIINGAATLNIEAGVEVRFSKFSKLIVHPGGTLNLAGALTSQCADTWYGVEVRGDPTASQYLDPTSIPSSAQGRFMASGAQSRVENADIAVRVYGPTFDKGGGVVICNGTTFRNNRVGVHFAPYENKYPQHPGKVANNLSRFTACSFQTDASFGQEDQFHAFLDFDGVRGIDIAGCEFSNTFVPTDCSDFIEFGHGIFSFTSSFKVHGYCPGAPCTTQPSRFEGLAYGVYASQNAAVGMPVLDKPHIVTQSIFRNCYVGIHLRYVAVPTVTYNEFLLGELPLPSVGPLGSQIGLTLDKNVFGITVQENYFAGDPASDWDQIGAMAIDLGTRNQVIRRNVFERMTYNNMAFQDNAVTTPTTVRGLWYECNTNTSTVKNDFTVDGEIRFHQGKENFIAGVYDAAGNTFALTADFHWSVENSNIVYHYNDQAPAEIPDPNKVTSTVGLEVAGENECEIQVPDESNPEFLPDVESAKAEYHQHKGPYLIAKAASETALAAGNTAEAQAKGHEASYHRLQADLAAAKVLRWLMLDTLQEGRDSVRAWMLNLDAFEGDLALAADHLGGGEAAGALAVLDNAAAKYNLNVAEAADLAEIREIFVMAIELAGEPHTAVQRDRLEEIAAKTGPGFAPAIARNVLTRYGAHYPPIFQLPGSERQAEQPIGPSSETINLQVFPNPADREVRFRWSNAYQAESLTITDVSGKVLKRFAVLPVEGQIEWDTRQIAPGIYFYQVRSASGRTRSGKIIIRH
jgi:hypothetical protein